MHQVQSSDSGHQSPGLSAAFAANAEALDNWAGASLKKVHDVAHHLIGKRYGSMPVRQYFAGGSQGGHEGFLVVQRYPKDYDGVIAYYPAYNFTGGVFNANHTTKAWFTVPGAALSAGKVGALNSAVLAACDALDGAVDELVSNTAACRAVFDVAALRCPSGADEGDACLSDVQIAALRTADAPTTWRYPLMAGGMSGSGAPVFLGAGSEMAVWVFGLAGSLGLGSTTFHNSILGTFADQYIKHVITKNPDFDSSTFNPGDWQEQAQAASRQIDASSVDIDAFKSKGGKLIMVHGTVDMLVNPGYSIDYHARLVAKYGRPTADTFTRFFTIPGLGHGIGPFLASWDSLAALDRWVEGGAAPDGQVVYDANPGAKLGRSRPLCAYPLWPKYQGSGDVASSASYTCAAS